MSSSTSPSLPSLPTLFGQKLFTISHEEYLINRSEGLSNDSPPAMK
jgi:hypothetical protein